MSMSFHPRDQLSAYLDGALTPAERTAVAAHLDTCVDCRARLSELRGVAALLGSLPDQVPSRRLTPRVAAIPVWLAPMRTLATLASGISVFLFMASAILANIGFLAQTSGSAALAPQGAPAASAAAEDRAAATPAPTSQPKAAATQPGAFGVTSAAPSPVPPTNASTNASATQVSERPSSGFRFGPSPWAWLILAIVTGVIALALQRRLRSV